MRQLAFRELGFARAPADVVFATLADHASWADWGQCDESLLEVEGVPAPNGLGSVRRLTMKATNLDVREEVNHYWPPHVWGYRVIDETLRDHQGIVVLTERDGGTEIAWQLTANPPDPSLVEVFREFVPPGLRQLIIDLATESERKAAAG